MANRELPRRESAPHLALRALQNIGGMATVSEIMRVRDWHGTQIGFCRDVIDRLERCGLINVVGAMCTVADAGRQYMGVPVASVPVAGVPVAPRYVAPMRPLNLAKHFPPRPLRPEGNDFRAIPSVMGGQRIKYGSDRA
jgi:hypothetical protein